MCGSTDCGAFESTGECDDGTLDAGLEVVGVLEEG